MSMILWIIAILLGLALLLLLVAVCLLSIRTGVDAVGIDGEVSVEARHGSLRIPVWPPPAPEPKEPQQSAAEEQPKKNEKKRKYHYVLNREALDIGEIADLALTMLSELADELRISRLRVRVRIATADAARTGMLLGGASALTGMLVPFLENTFEMRDYHVDVDADFEEEQTHWAFTVSCSLRPLRLLWVLLRHGRELYRLYKRLIRKEEAIEHE